MSSSNFEALEFVDVLVGRTPVPHIPHAAAAHRRWLSRWLSRSLWRAGGCFLFGVPSVFVARMFLLAAQRVCCVFLTTNEAEEPRRSPFDSNSGAPSRRYQRLFRKMVQLCGGRLIHALPKRTRFPTHGNLLSPTEVVCTHEVSLPRRRNRHHRAQTRMTLRSTEPVSVRDIRRGVHAVTPSPVRAPASLPRGTLAPWRMKIRFKMSVRVSSRRALSSRGTPVPLR